MTRHHCVEGWSAVGKWTGGPLGHLLASAGLKITARYVVFHCADDDDPVAIGSVLVDMVFEWA
ncbi:molybdopterin-dependent oxidoreductase [Rhizobium sullae]|uniref:molybdopterin-dependent oxidoreductase n=1 Tax=Rhizobium sullae TaxID=50338 RepID=UPI003CC7E3B3